MDKTGRVLGRNIGEAVITAITVDGGLTAECKVTVIENPDPSGSYKLYIVDQRTKDNPHKDKVRAAVEVLTADRYLILLDSDGNRIKALISGDGSLEYNIAVFYVLRLTDAAGNDVNDSRKCTIRIPLISDMDIYNGSVRVVGIADNKLDKSIPSSTGIEDGVQYVTFTIGYYSEFAILYRLKSTPTGNNSPNYSSSSYVPSMQNTGSVPNNNMRILDSIPRTGEYDLFYGKNDEKKKRFNKILNNHK